MTKAERSRNLRYKKPALASMGYHEILDKLDEISDACGDIEWLVESDNETLLNALDGDEEETYEFRMAFSILSVECEQIYEMLTDYHNNRLGEYFDVCTVALIGNRFNAVGYDDFEEDYFSLTGATLRSFTSFSGSFNSTAAASGHALRLRTMYPSKMDK